MGTVRQLESSRRPAAIGHCPSPTPLVAVFQTHKRMELCKRASRHYAGSGLEFGADFRSIKRELERFRTKEQYDMYGLTLTIVAGGL